jgi:hypothetical protein
MSGSVPNFNSQQLGGINGGQLSELLNQGGQQKPTGSSTGSSTSPSTPGPSSIPKPRDVSSLTDELVKRPAGDIVESLQAFFSLNTWLGIAPPNPDSQEDVMRKQKIHQRYQQLTQEQQQIAQQKYQEQLQRKKMEEEEKERRKQAEEQQKAQEIVMPSSPQKGPVGPSGSGKQRAVQKLTQDRKTLSSPSGSN